MRNIENRNLSDKPGWVRVSLHPIMTNAEVQTIIEALGKIIDYGVDWALDYKYNLETNEFDSCIADDSNLRQIMRDMFSINNIDCQ